MRSRSILKPACIALAVLALAGCARKAAWKPLFDPPDPNRTPGILLPGDSPAPGAEGQPDDGTRLFTTDADSMAAPHVVIYKSRHVLEVWDGDTLMARLAVALGQKEGAKARSGDNKTPEGQYYVCKLSEEGRYYKSLFISYPNADDALAGLNEGVIKQDQYDDITRAVDRRQVPLWNTKLGGEIAISGTGTIGTGRTGDWTGGNVALSDKDMDYLWNYITAGVDVVINP